MSLEESAGRPGKLQIERDTKVDSGGSHESWTKGGKKSGMKKDITTKERAWMSLEEGADTPGKLQI